MRKQVEVLEHHADLAPHGIDIAQIASQLDPIDNNLPLLVLLETVDAADHRRLARSRRAADNDLLPLLDGQIHIAQNMELAVPFVDCRISMVGCVAAALAVAAVFVEAIGFPL